MTERAFRRGPATADAFIREGDSAPAIEATLTYQDGEQAWESASEVDTATILIRSAQTKDVIYQNDVGVGSGGSVTYNFTGGFASTATGTHEVYWRVEFADGRRESFPEGDFLYLYVADRFDEDTMPFVLLELATVDEPIDVVQVPDDSSLSGEDEGFYYITESENVVYWIP